MSKCSHKIFPDEIIVIISKRSIVAIHSTLSSFEANQLFTIICMCFSDRYPFAIIKMQ